MQHYLRLITVCKLFIIIKLIFLFTYLINYFVAPFYYQSTPFDLMQNNPSQISTTHAVQINASQINTAQINNILPNNTLQIRSPSPPHFDEY